MFGFIFSLNTFFLNNFLILLCSTQLIRSDLCLVRLSHNEVDLETEPRGGSGQKGGPSPSYIGDIAGYIAI